MLNQLFPLFRVALWAADGAGDGGGGDASAGEAGSTPTGGGQTPGDDAPTGGAAGTGTGTPGDDRRFTQEELNRIAAGERKQAVSKFVKDLGLESVDDLKTIIKAKKDADDQAKSELDKATEKVAGAEKHAAEMEQLAHNALLRAAFDRAGADKIAELDLAFLAAREAGLLNDDNGVAVDLKTGAVSGMDKVIEKLLKDKPILKKAPQAQAGGTGGAEGSTAHGAGVNEAGLRARFGL